jgi:hypothetical protein
LPLETHIISLRQRKCRFPISSKGIQNEDDQDGEGDLPLFDATIGDKRRMTIPKPALSLLLWRGEIEAQAALTFDFVDRGRVRLLRGAAYDAAVASAKGDPDMIAEIRMVLLPWRWATKNSLVVPRRVTTHILGADTLAGPLYVWAEPEWLALWSDERRLVELSRARSIAAEHLPD